MGISFPEIREHVVPWIIEHLKPKTVLDLGCGFGYYGRDLKAIDNNIKLTGIEAFVPYLEDKKSWTDNYDRIIIGDLKDNIHLAKEHDVTLMMDIIEHFNKSVAIAMINSINNIVVSTPLFDYIQGVEDHNVLQIHKCFFAEKELDDLGFKTITRIKFPGRDGDIGAFIKWIA